MSQNKPVTRSRVTKPNGITIHQNDAIIIHTIHRLNDARTRLNACLDDFNSRWGIDWTEYNTRTRKRRR